MKKVTIMPKDRFGGRWIITETDRYYWYDDSIDLLYLSLIEEEGQDHVGTD
nr:MAG TPA: phosphoprotein [Bacteriophage sp.]